MQLPIVAKGRSFRSQMMVAHHLQLSHAQLAMAMVIEQTLSFVPPPCQRLTKGSNAMLLLAVSNERCLALSEWQRHAGYRTVAGAACRWYALLLPSPPPCCAAASSCGRLSLKGRTNGGKQCSDAASAASRVPVASHRRVNRSSYVASHSRRSSSGAPTQDGVSTSGHVHEISHGPHCQTSLAGSRWPACI